jgi:hypothetical protein
VKTSIDPPKPSLPVAYSCAWILNETEGARGFHEVSSGATEIDQAGHGKHRELTVMKRSSNLHPGLNFYMEIDAITIWETGDSWTRTCSNQTGTEVCDCKYLPVSGDMPHQDPRGWSFVGEATIDGEPCINWLVAPSHVWSVSKAKPNLLLRAAETGGSNDPIDQSFSKYVLEAPLPSRWLVPTAWNCSK